MGVLCHRGTCARTARGSEKRSYYIIHEASKTHAVTTLAVRFPSSLMLTSFLKSSLKWVATGKGTYENVRKILF